jgi:hypothetical protein
LVFGFSGLAAGPTFIWILGVLERIFLSEYFYRFDGVYSGFCVLRQCEKRYTISRLLGLDRFT